MRMLMSDSTLDIFDVLSNETRRRILEILAEEPAYLNQLTREIKVSQQAILKHLEYLEERGVVRSFVVRGEGGTPPKKYYELDESVLVLSELARGILGRVGRVAAGLEPTSEVSVRVDIGRERRRLEEIASLGSSEEKIRALRDYVCSIEDALERVSQAYYALTKLKVEALAEARRVLRERFGSPEDRRLLLRAISMDDEELREYFRRMIESQREWVQRIFDEMKGIFGGD